MDREIRLTEQELLTFVALVLEGIVTEHAAAAQEKPVALSLKRVAEKFLEAAQKSSATFSIEPDRQQRS